VPGQLTRYYGLKHLHFITCSCYHGRPVLGTPDRRDLFLSILDEVRQRHRFVVCGYVVMPEHFHLLISEPESGDSSVVMKVVKQEYWVSLSRMFCAGVIPKARAFTSGPRACPERP
jgi:putative transposase